jgi:hypothetical protein
MNKGIELLIKITTIKDIEIALLDAELAGETIPKLVYEIIRKVQASYKQDLDPVIINELTEKN